MPAAVTEEMAESEAGDATAELNRMRETIARLEAKVRTLDALAHQDSLLAVPNRRGFLRELESAIARVGRYGESAAMLFVDIDGLKRINDSFGHKAGDDALIHVSTALTAGVRKSDCVGRLGGDEFGILLSHADEESARDTADRLTRSIQSNASNCDGNQVSLGVAIGLTAIKPGDTPDGVIGRADRAMYKRKAAA